MKVVTWRLALLVVGVSICFAPSVLASPQEDHSKKVPLILSGKEEHVSEFLEDPFVTKYRKKFFAVFAGKTGEFEQGMKELEAMLKENPKDARALVWHGNGLMVRAGLLKLTSKGDEPKQMLAESKKELDRAVSLDPDNVNILAMRAVTLHIAGKYWKDEELPVGSWEAIIADLEKSKKIIRPDRMSKLSTHARGEILSELATAYQRLGKAKKAVTAWNEVKKQVPDSRYSKMAEEALDQLQKPKAAPAVNP